MQPPDSPPQEPMTPKPIQVSQASPPSSPSKIPQASPPSSPSKIPQASPPSSPSKVSQASPPSPSRVSHGQLSFSTNIPPGSQRSSTQTAQGSPQLGAQTSCESPHSCARTSHESPRSDKQTLQKSSSAQSTPSPGKVPLSYPPPPNQTPTNTTPTMADWSTGLFACHSDITNCCISFFCPCITFGQITDIVDKGTSSCAINGALYALLAVVFGCACFYSALYRRKMRLQFNLKGSDLGDCCIHSFCEICALSQEYRELQLRGWQGSNDRKNQGAITTPPQPESMSRE